jgi:hypothetical protein
MESANFENSNWAHHSQSRFLKKLFPSSVQVDGAEINSLALSKSL